MKARRWARSGAVLVLILASAGSAFSATDEERAGARAAAAEGQRAFEEGRYAEAADFFIRAESLVHALPHLVYIGRSYAKLGKLVKAREAYLKAKRENLADTAPPPIKAAQEAAIAELPAVEARLARITIVVEGGGTKAVRVAMDGQAVPSALVGVPYPADPGAHTLVAEADGLRSAPVEVTLEEGGQQQVVLKLVPTEEAPVEPVKADGSGSVSSDDLKPGGMSTMRLGSYISFGVGAVGLGVGIGFMVSANGSDSDADSLFDSCDPGCTSGQQAEIRSVEDDAKSARTLSTVGFIVGGVGVAAGATLLLLDLNQSSAKVPAVQPWVGLGSAGVRGTF